MAETLLAVGVGTAGAGGGAAGATLFGSTTAFSALSSVPTLLSIGSAVTSIAGGYQGAAVSKAQAQQAELTARQEELKGREQATQIRRQLAASLASQNAIFAARGINPNIGTPSTISTESQSQAARDIDISRFGATQASGALRSQAQQYRIEGTAKKLEGFTGAAKSMYSLVR